jgi:hypothetical protein
MKKKLIFELLVHGTFEKYFLTVASLSNPERFRVYFLKVNPILFHLPPWQINKKVILFLLTLFCQNFYRINSQAFRSI